MPGVGMNVLMGIYRNPYPGFTGNLGISSILFLPIALPAGYSPALH